MKFTQNTKKLLERFLFRKGRVEIDQNDLCIIEGGISSEEEYLQLVKYIKNNEIIFHLYWAVSPHYIKKIYQYLLDDPLITSIAFDISEDDVCFRKYKSFIAPQKVLLSEKDSYGNKHIVIPIKTLDSLLTHDEDWRKFSEQEWWHLLIGEVKEDYNKEEKWVIEQFANTIARFHFYNNLKNMEELLRKQFVKWLREQNNEISDIKIEDNNVDVKFKIDNNLYYAELKICDRQSPKRAIRNAIAQLLEYSYYPGNTQASYLIIVLDSCPSKEDIEFINILKKRSGFPLKICWKNETDFTILGEL